MKFELTGGAAEIYKKAPQLFRRLATDLAPGSEVAKALLDLLDEMETPERRTTLRDPALEGIRKDARAIYSEHVDRMLAEIGEVIAEVEALNQPLTKALEIARSSESTAEALVLCGFDPDGQPLFGEETLEKARGHKYLGRFPTGNPKRPWRYVYKYSGEKFSGKYPELLEYNHQPAVGTAIRDKPTDHEGHWHVVSVGNEAEGKDIKIRHDETGEEKTFGSSWEYRSFIHDLHSAAISEHKKATLSRRSVEAKAAVATALKTAETIGRPNSVKDARSLSIAWNRAAARANDGEWGTKEWAEALGVPTKLPATFKKFRAEYHALREEIGKHSLYDSFADSNTTNTLVAVRDVERMKKEVRFAVLHAAIGRYNSQPLRNYQVDSHELALELRGGGLSPPDVEDAIVKLLKKHYSYDAKKISRSKLSGVAIQWDLNSREQMADPELRAALQAIDNAAASRESLLFVRPTKRMHSQANSELRYKTAHMLEKAVERIAMPAPNPRMYSLSYQHMVDAEDVAKVLSDMKAGNGKLSAYDSIYPEAVDEIVEFLRDGGDPAVSVTTKITKKGDNFSSEISSLPLSHWLRVSENEGRERVAKYRNEHAARVEKLEKASGEVEKALGSFSEIQKTALEKIFETAQLTPEQREAVIAKGVATQNWQTWSLTAAIARAKFPKEEELSSYSNQDAASREAAEKIVRPLRAQLREAARTAVLEQIREKLDIKPDAQKGHANIELEANEKVSNDDKAAVLKSMDHLFNFVDQSVLAKTKIRLEAGKGRAHASKFTGILLYDGDFRGGQVPWHEYGHQIEHQSKGITAAANALRDQRGRTSALKQLGEEYRADEHAYADEWWNSYVGKWYGHLGSTEVLSMGIQELLDDPVHFHSIDKEHFYFTLAALSGRLGARDG